MFKSHVSPHEFIQSVSVASEKKFSNAQQSDPISFIPWFFNTLIQSNKNGFKKLIQSTF